VWEEEELEIEKGDENPTTIRTRYYRIIERHATFSRYYERHLDGDETDTDTYTGAV
jgi:hypothetical protein